MKTKTKKNENTTIKLVFVTIKYDGNNIYLYGKSDINNYYILKIEFKNFFYIKKDLYEEIVKKQNLEQFISNKELIKGRFYFGNDNENLEEDFYKCFLKYYKFIEPIEGLYETKISIINRFKSEFCVSNLFEFTFRSNDIKQEIHFDYPKINAKIFDLDFGTFLKNYKPLDPISKESIDLMNYDCINYACINLIQDTKGKDIYPVALLDESFLQHKKIKEFVSSIKKIKNENDETAPIRICTIMYKTGEKLLLTTIKTNIQNNGFNNSYKKLKIKQYSNEVDMIYDFLNHIILSDVIIGQNINHIYDSQSISYLFKRLLYHGKEYYNMKHLFNYFDISKSNIKQRYIKGLILNKRNIEEDFVTIDTNNILDDFGKLIEPKKKIINKPNILEKNSEKINNKSDYGNDKNNIILGNKLTSYLFYSIEKKYDKNDEIIINYSIQKIEWLMNVITNNIKEICYKNYLLAGFSGCSINNLNKTNLAFSQILKCIVIIEKQYNLRYILGCNKKYKNYIESFNLTHIKGGIRKKLKEESFFKDVFSLDYVSMYPSIFEEFNIDPSSLLISTKIDNENVFAININEKNIKYIKEDEEKHTFTTFNEIKQKFEDLPLQKNVYFLNDEKSRKMSVIPNIFKQLLYLKKNYNDRDYLRDLYKITANSIYGVLITELFSKILNGPCNFFSSIVTFLARKLISNTAEILERNNSNLIQIDTDGIFFQSPNLNGDKTKAEEFIIKINKEINEEFSKQFLKKNLCLSSAILKQEESKTFDFKIKLESKFNYLCPLYVSNYIALNENNILYTKGLYDCKYTTPVLFIDYYRKCCSHIMDYFISNDNNEEKLLSKIKEVYKELLVTLYCYKYKTFEQGYKFNYDKLAIKKNIKLKKDNEIDITQTMQQSSNEEDDITNYINMFKYNDFEKNKVFLIRDQIEYIYTILNIENKKIQNNQIVQFYKDFLLKQTTTIDCEKYSSIFFDEIIKLLKKTLNKNMDKFQIDLLIISNYYKMDYENNFNKQEKQNLNLDIEDCFNNCYKCFKHIPDLMNLSFDFNVLYCENLKCEYNLINKIKMNHFKEKNINLSSDVIKK